MICTSSHGEKYIVKFRYVRSRKRHSRVKTTCSIRLVGLHPEDAVVGTVSLDSRDHHIKSIARKKSLAKALGNTILTRENRGAIWTSFFAQIKK